MRKHINKKTKSIRKIFITGFITILPASVTISLIFWLLNKIDVVFREPLESLIGFPIYGIGFLITVVLIFITGLFAMNVLGKEIFHLFDHFMHKMPLVNIVYASIKQLLEAIRINQKNSFKSAILVQYPKEGIYTIGFVTADAPEFISKKLNKVCISIFIPTTPNPTSGMFVMVPKEDIIYLDLSVEEAIKLVVSGGMLDITKNRR
ncbi:MAG: DUF502 domain-containing protein [Peptostreptococcaceae bacterium]|jgi:uncharacterized membrane protein|nr:DUF502 domain-containing protein [Peptostreptococcaceae bacterium]